MQQSAIGLALLDAPCLEVGQCFNCDTLASTSEIREPYLIVLGAGDYMQSEICDACLDACAREYWASITD